MHRQFLREVEHRGFVGLRHQPEFDFAGVGLDVARIGSCFAHAQTDLSLNQESSLGHNRFTALAPAATLM